MMVVLDPKDFQSQPALQTHPEYRIKTTNKLTNVQLLALLPHRHAKAAVLRRGALSRRIEGENEINPHQ